MRTFIVFVIGIIAGGALSLLVLPGALVGAGAGAGIVTGVKAGACLTVEAARSSGHITDEQVDPLLNAAAAELGSDAEFTGSNAECEKFIAEMKAAAEKAR